MLQTVQGNIIDMPDETESIDKRIRNTFAVLNKVTDGIVKRYIRSVIISGASGCGKTHTLESGLVRAEAEGRIRYQIVKGAMSAIGLYRQLFECSEPNNVLVIDDCDSIFGDLDALNLLKAALDTGKSRKVHWNKESKILDGEGIPRSFEFKGAVAFITNIDFSAEIEQEKKMSPHYRALLSRCMYVDLGIHSKQEILVRIKQVVFGPEFLEDSELTKEQAQEMVRWLTMNITRVRTLSIRTVLQLASLVKTDPDWKDMARAIMLKTR